ncbi:MAG: hypothetical protein B6U89_06645 [Desulfurococcales archaeon ex4484_58]|nr:MAG: hypothetical protein B6U89_06645 [Desulfurococcales archaeon ex4484_58]
MKIRVEAIVNPTEDPKKVRKAVENVFDGEILVREQGNGYMKIEGFSTDRSALNKLYNLIRTYQIISAARSYLLKGLSGNRIVILLHKQAAYVKKLSFIDSDKESPLGAIKILIETSDPRELIDWLAPELKTIYKKHSSRSK